MRTELWKKTASQYSLVVILETLSIQLACFDKQLRFSPPPVVLPDPARGRGPAGRGSGGRGKNQFFYVVHSISSYCHPRVRGMKVVSEAVTPRETTRMNVLWIRTCKNRRLHPSGDVDRVSKEDRWMDISRSPPPLLSLALLHARSILSWRASPTLLNSA